MAELSIKTYPDNVLRRKAKEVASIGDEEREIASRMIKIMRQANGVGLAAPQVGVSKRIMVAEDAENNKSIIVLINPNVIKKKGKSLFCEGCLSLPGVTANIIRPEYITLDALTLDSEGRKIRIETGGLLARIIQHEIDHLDGVLFIDRVSFLKRKKIMRQISKNVCMEL